MCIDRADPNFFEANLILKNVCFLKQSENLANRAHLDLPKLSNGASVYM